MQTTQQPSTFAQIIDKLRSKSEEDLKQLYMQLSKDDLVNEWKDITQNADFENATEEDIVKAIRKTDTKDCMKMIIDANVWVRYARAKDIAPILHRLTLYRLTPVVNNYLLSEIFDALVGNRWMHQRDAGLVIEFIKKIAIFTTETAVYAMSPDPKDNYLFDLAIQNHCVFIISDDALLLNFNLKPVSVYSSSWFLKKFLL